MEKVRSSPPPALGRTTQADSSFLHPTAPTPPTTPRQVVPGRKGRSRRPMPRIHQGGVIAVEVTDRRLHVEVFPGFRDQHGQRVPNVAATPHQELYRVVGHRRVRPGLIDDGPEQV